MASNIRWRHVTVFAVISVTFQYMVCALPLQARDADSTDYDPRTALNVPSGIPVSGLSPPNNAAGTGASSQNLPGSTPTGGGLPLGVPSAGSNNVPSPPDTIPSPGSGSNTQGGAAGTSIGNNALNVPASPPVVNSGDVPPQQDVVHSNPNNQFPSNIPALPAGAVNNAGSPNLPTSPGSAESPIPPPVNGGQMFPPNMPPPPPGALNDAPPSRVPSPPANGMFPPNMPPPPPGAFADQPSAPGPVPLRPVPGAVPGGVPGAVPDTQTLNGPNAPAAGPPPPPQGVPELGTQDEAIANMYPRINAAAVPALPSPFNASSNIPAPPPAAGAAQSKANLGPANQDTPVDTQGAANQDTPVESQGAANQDTPVDTQGAANQDTPVDTQGEVNQDTLVDTQGAANGDTLEEAHGAANEDTLAEAQGTADEDILAETNDNTLDEDEEEGQGDEDSGVVESESESWDSSKYEEEEGGAYDEEDSSEESYSEDGSDDDSTWEGSEDGSDDSVWDGSEYSWLMADTSSDEWDSDSAVSDSDSTEWDSDSALSDSDSTEWDDDSVVSDSDSNEWDSDDNTEWDFEPDTASDDYESDSYSEFSSLGKLFGISSEEESWEEPADEWEKTEELWDEDQDQDQFKEIEEEDGTMKGMKQNLIPTELHDDDEDGGTMLVLYCIPAIILSVLIVLAWRNYRGKIRVVSVTSGDIKHHDWRTTIPKADEQLEPMLGAADRENTY